MMLVQAWGRAAIPSQYSQDWAGSPCENGPGKGLPALQFAQLSLPLWGLV